VKHFMTADDTLAEVCEIAEAAARQYVLSKVDKRLIKSLDVLVTYDKDGATFTVDVSIELEPLPGMDADALADEASDAALSAIDSKMRV